MSGIIVANEVRIFVRNRSALALSALFVVLIVAAAWLGVDRATDFTRQRVAAEHVDERVWQGQGDRNPHSAAHFSRYAFKPLPALSVFDPGVLDYVGILIWMEAHYQDPALHRRAEDAGETTRLTRLTPAWVLQVFAPLTIVLTLFASIAGEREDGTLRQMVATGLPTLPIIAGKLSGAGLSLALILIPALAIGIVIALGTSELTMAPDFTLRLVGLVIVYSLYFAVIAAITIGVSALAASRRNAFLMLTVLWTISVVLAPRFSADVAVRLHPTPSNDEIQARLHAAGSDYWEDEDLQENQRRDLLAQHGVETVEELPFNWDAYQLNRSEEYGHERFDAVYGELNAIHNRQEGVMTGASVFSPTIAIARLSAGLAGTDRQHHLDFVAAAEAHRRKTVGRLNNEMLVNARGVGYEYIAGEALWADIDTFKHVPPRFSSLASHYLASAALLVAYLAAALVFAVWAMHRAQKKVVRS